MISLSPDRTLHPRNPPYRLTVAQYNRMIRAGLLPEGAPYELIDGVVLRKDRSAVGEDPMTVGTRHTWVVQKLMDLNPRLRKLGCHIRIQQPVQFPPRHEPEPDAAIVRGSPDDYRDRKPLGADVTSIIEVAEASLDFDRTVKLPIYAAGGIGQYIIINLVDRRIEVYQNPDKRHRRYHELTLLERPARLTLVTPLGKGLTLPARNLLPA
ncbi:Uma2 family endonuclease [Fontivita pretiosa]|uniref:Uma2 family endonuclease n=1 Tax=Fontivita pretiosa TaxID=2989684 RepID=UPI003D17DBAF